MVAYYKTQCYSNCSNDCMCLFLQPIISQPKHAPKLKHLFSDTLFNQYQLVERKASPNCSVNVKRRLHGHNPERDKQTLISGWDQKSAKSCDNEECRNSHSPSRCPGVPPLSLIGCHARQHPDLCRVCVIVNIRPLWAAGCPRR